MDLKLISSIKKSSLFVCFFLKYDDYRSFRCFSKSSATMKLTYWVSLFFFRRAKRSISKGYLREFENSESFYYFLLSLTCDNPLRFFNLKRYIQAFIGQRVLNFQAHERQGHKWQYRMPRSYLRKQNRNAKNFQGNFRLASRTLTHSG